jgi:hypothetical protein
MTKRNAAPSLRAQDIEDKNDAIVNAWLEMVTRILSVQSGATDPTIAHVPSGQWIIFKNTALNEIRIWTNDNGTMKKSAALT